MYSGHIEVQKFHNCEWEYFSDFDNEFGRLWEEIEKSLGRNFINYIGKYFQKNLVHIIGKEFKLKLIVDTNIVFSQVLSYVLNGRRPWILDFAKNPFIELYAPPLIKKELEDKIETVIPKKCKKKKLDENVAKHKAKKIVSIILSNIRIINDSNLGRWKLMAYELIGHRDVKDIPFLTLALSLDAHGIITRDKDFEEQKIVKIWEVNEVKVILTEFSQGSFSFCILNVTMSLAFKICTSIIITILEVITSIAKKLIESFAIIIENGVRSLSETSEDILIILGLILGIILITNQSKIVNLIREIIEGIKNTFLKLIESLKNILEPLLLFVKFNIRAVGYLFYKTTKTINEIKKLENYKPNKTSHI